MRRRQVRFKALIPLVPRTLVEALQGLVAVLDNHRSASIASKTRAKLAESKGNFQWTAYEFRHFATKKDTVDE